MKIPGLSWSSLKNDPNYTPNHLFNVVMELLEVKSDTELGKIIGISQSTISKIRSKRAILGARVIIGILDNTSLSIAEVRRLSGFKKC